MLNEEDMIDVFKRLFKLSANMDAAQKRGGVMTILLKDEYINRNPEKTFI